MVYISLLCILYITHQTVFAGNGYITRIYHDENNWLRKSDKATHSNTRKFAQMNMPFHCFYICNIIYRKSSLSSP